MLLNSLRSLAARAAGLGRARRVPSRCPPRRRLELEILEGRMLPSYAFTPLDVPGSAVTEAWAINDSGNIVGSYTAGGTTHGFLLEGGGYTTIDVPGATSTVATGINDPGQIVGSYTLGGVTHAFLFSRGAFTTFDVPGASFTMPRGINDAGDIVGEYRSGGVAHGFLFSGGAYTTIDVPGATFTAYASGINGPGEVVGRFDARGTNFGYLLSDGAYTTLHYPGAVSSAALGINERGQIVGGYTAAGARHGYVLNNGVYTSLDVPGASFTTPRKNNNRGQIVGSYGSGGTTHGFLATPVRSETVARPNFVFILTDDQDTATMPYMPQVQELLADEGVTFENAFVTEPLCCPSNVSILTGQYPHNHQILHNFLPLGGWQKFHDQGGENSTIATWLQDAGYHTGRIGKYLVDYPNRTTYVPPGWNDWHTIYSGFSSYFNYALNENGRVVDYGAKEEEYITDVFTQRAVEFIDRAEANDAQPFFLFFAPTAPHGGAGPNGPPTPAPRHHGMFADLRAPRPPSFNEADVSDKPAAIATLPLLTAPQIAAIDLEYQARLESLQALDEGIERIVQTLAERGELENTYIFFTSDNGYHLGQHRLFNGKGQIYEEDIRVPLIVRGPGVAEGETRDHFALNIDFAPTLVELGRARVPADFVVDGKSLLPLLGEGKPPPHQWRRDFLVETHRAVRNQPPGDILLALRTLDEVYVEHSSRSGTPGARELYDLRRDPYQLQNLYDVAPKGHLKQLSERLAELAACAGDCCRDKDAGDGSWQPGPNQRSEASPATLAAFLEDSWAALPAAAGPSVNHFSTSRTTAPSTTAAALSPDRASVNRLFAADEDHAWAASHPGRSRLDWLDRLWADVTEEGYGLEL
jgi:N-acetylglucosamine-6-sulfatase